MFNCEPFSWKCAWGEIKHDFRIMDRPKTWARLILTLALIAVAIQCIEFTAR